MKKRALDPVRHIVLVVLCHRGNARVRPAVVAIANIALPVVLRRKEIDLEAFRPISVADVRAQRDGVTVRNAGGQSEGRVRSELAANLLTAVVALNIDIATTANDLI